MRISVNCPSYKRPKVETLAYLPFCKVWVCETEYEAYKAANPGHEENIIPCKKGIQGNLCRIRNHILDTEFENGADVVLIIDDDMRSVGYYESAPGDPFGYDRHIVQTDDFLPFIEKYSRMCAEFGFYYWGLNCNIDARSYQQNIPFSTVAYIGGPFQCFLRGNECRYDEALPLKEDYDMTLQNCNRYRGCLRVNKYHYNVKQAEQAGGCATYRNYTREEQQLEALRKKWGSRIVKIDKSNKGKTKKEKVNIDFNPIIKVPIKGV